MKKLLFTLLLATTIPTYPRTSAPLDSLLAQFDDSISTCLDDATRLDEARALILQVLAMEGIEQSELYPVMLFHEGTYYLNIGDVARWKQNRQRMLQMLPFNDYPELSISVPQELGLICRREGQIDSALYYYDQALQEALRQGDKEWLAAISALRLRCFCQRSARRHAPPLCTCQGRRRQMVARQPRTLHRCRPV